MLKAGDILVLYWDLILASTIFVNFSFIKTLLLLFKERIIWWRVILAMAISVASLFIYFLPAPLLFLRYTVGIWMGIVAFPGRTKTKIIQIAGLYVLNYAFIGSLVVFNIQSLLWIILSLLYIVILYLISNPKLSINQSNLTYDVIILSIGKLKAYLDTGNLSTFNGKPIVFLDEKWFGEMFEVVGTIAIETITGTTDVLVYQGNIMQIGKTTYEVYYCFANLQTYDVLLNYTMGVEHD